MRLHRLVPIILIVALVGIAAPATFVGAEAVREVAIVNIAGPVEVQRLMLTGKYVFEHDSDRMARGEPCTAVYEFNPSGLGRKVLSFHCLPREASTTGVFTMKVQRREGFPAPRMVEYQFAGSGHAHGIPLK